MNITGGISMENFSNIDGIEISYRSYGGAGKKYSVRDNGEYYLLKLPERVRQNNRDTSYANSCVTEYISCKVIKSLGLDVQDVFLCTYNNDLVVACKDFLSKEESLGSFLELQNKVNHINSDNKGVSLEKTLQFIKEQEVVKPDEMERYFWDMFVVDALIGNIDRHHNNWGYIFNEETNIRRMSPIYDCGASLYPILSEDEKKKFLDDSSAFNRISKNDPVSVFKFNNVRMNYYHILVDNRKNNYECSNDIAEAIKRIAPKYNSEIVHAIIREIPYISHVEKEFYAQLLDNRNRLIIQKALKNELKYQKDINQRDGK